MKTLSRGGRIIGNGHVSNRVIAEWQGRLRHLIGRYEAYRGRTRRFWRYLFLLFFVLNCICYQFAIMTAFPERAFGGDWLRYVLIMFPVGLFGATFDCASFVVTLAIMRHAIRVRSRLIYLGHVSVDIAIAILATGWVLIVFSVSTVLVDFVIGPPESVAPATRSQAPSKPPAPAPSVEVPVIPPAPAATPGPAAPPKKPAVVPAPTPEKSIDHAQFMSARAEGYRARVTSALDDPFSPENLRNIYFGVVMGASAMLPSLVHLYLGLAALIAVVTGSASRRRTTQD